METCNKHDECVVVFQTSFLGGQCPICFYQMRVTTERVYQQGIIDGLKARIKTLEFVILNIRKMCHDIENRNKVPNPSETQMAHSECAALIGAIVNAKIDEHTIRKATPL